MAGRGIVDSGRSVQFPDITDELQAIFNSGGGGNSGAEFGFDPFSSLFPEQFGPGRGGGGVPLSLGDKVTPFSGTLPGGSPIGLSPLAAPAASSGGGLGAFFNSPLGLGTFGLAQRLLGGLIGGDDEGEYTSMVGTDADPIKNLAQARQLITALMGDITSKQGQPISVGGADPINVPGVPFTLGEGLGGTVPGAESSELIKLLASILNPPPTPNETGLRPRPPDSPVIGKAVPRVGAPPTRRSPHDRRS